MKTLALGLTAVCLTVGVAAAQTGNAGSGTNSNTGTTGSVGKTVGNAVGVNHNDKAAASGDNNQAIATTDANASQPAHGSNSFTADQARGRIQDHGFSNVTDLKKDDSGVWRGHAQKNGQTVGVWLDYKGNVGQQAF